MRIWIVVAAILTLPTPALSDGLDYAHWRIRTEEWRRGFMASAITSLADVVKIDDNSTYDQTRGYRNCFKRGISEDNAIFIVDNFISKHPELVFYSMSGVVIQAMQEECALYLPKHIQ